MITVVEVIVAGPQGVPGTPGASTHPGGATNQVLAKLSDTDYDVVWIDVDASNVTFGSAEGLVSTTVSTAIDEVEASRQANEVTLNKSVLSDKLVVDVTLNDLDNALFIPGVYIVDADNSLPASLTSATLTVMTDPTDSNYTQFLTSTSNGKDYVRSKIGVGAWSAWAEQSFSGRVTAVETQLAAPLQEGQMASRVDDVPYVEGKFYYNGNTGTFNIMGPYPGIEVSPGHGMHLHVVNNSGATITAGMAVRANGVSGGIVQVVPALADTFSHARVIGMAIIDIPNATESAVATSGLVTNINTNGLPVGSPMYLSDTIPGTYSAVAPAIRTVIGGVFVSDASIGVLRLEITPNQSIPNVFGGLQGQSGTGAYSLTTSPQDLVGYNTETSIVTTVDKTTGIITLPNDGQYRVHFTADISFDSSTSTRTVYVELYDISGAFVHFSYKKNIPKSATTDSLSFSWPISEVAGNTHKIRVSASEAISVVVEDVSFDIASISITS